MLKQTSIGVALLLASGVVAQASAADIVMYDALDFAPAVAKAFTAKTGITVDVVEPGSTGETLGKIAAEGSNPQFDIVWLDGSAVMERMVQDHVLQPVPADIYGKIAFTEMGKTLLPKSHAYVPTGASTTAIEINTKKVAAGEMPKSWADLQKFAGTVAAKDPNLSGPAYQWLAGYFQTVGVELGKKQLEATLTNKKLAGLSSGGKVNKAVLTGDAKLGINQDSAIIAQKAAGEPVVAVYPKEGSIALPEGLGISAHSQHLDAVRKFIAFIMSPEGQAAMQNGDDTDFYFIPLVKGVKPKAGRDEKIKFVMLNDTTATAHETEWKQWYKETFVP